MHENKIIIDEIEVFYRFYGDMKNQKKIIILHGWNQKGGESWLNFAKNISDKYAKIVVDLPGFGKSSEPKSPWNTENYADWLLKFINEIRNVNNFSGSEREDFEKNEHSKWTIIGHSFGGAIAGVFAGKYPNFVRKLLLIAPATIRSNRENTTNSTNSKIKKKLVRIAKSVPFLNLFRPFLRSILGSRDYNQSSPMKKEIMKIVLQENTLNFLRKYPGKIVLFWGTTDTYTPYSEAKIITDTIKSAKLVTFENINHGLHLNALEKLTEEVNKEIN